MPIGRERARDSTAAADRYREHSIDHGGSAREPIQVAGGIRRVDLPTRGVGPFRRARELLAVDRARSRGRERRGSNQYTRSHRFSLSQVMVAPKYTERSNRLDTMNRRV